MLLESLFKMAPHKIKTYQTSRSVTFQDQVAQNLASFVSKAQTSKRKEFHVEKSDLTDQLSIQKTKFRFQNQKIM